MVLIAVSVAGVAGAGAGDEARDASQVSSISKPTRMFASDPASAVATPTTFGIQGEFANNPRATKHLEKIVVLCATRPESNAFRHEWKTFVKKHPDINIANTIDGIVTNAVAYRDQVLSETERKSQLSESKTRQMMHDTAMAIIRKSG